MAKLNAILLRADPLQCLVPSPAWEVLLITLKLAKVFPPDRCLALQTSGGILNLMELHKIRFHIETILLSSMEAGDYLMPDLCIADQHPSEAFLEGDERREQYTDRPTLERILDFIREARTHAQVRRVSLLSASR